MARAKIAAIFMLHNTTSEGRGREKNLQSLIFCFYHAASIAHFGNKTKYRDRLQTSSEYLNRNTADIPYNYLNLPSKITFGDGSTIVYLYGADGTKLRTTHTIDGTVTTTDYCGSLMYENGMAKHLLTQAGYVSLNDNKYHYYLQDHLGNNRVVVNQNGDMEETNHYYPFGSVFANTNSMQPYKYNGKELDTKKGLNWYDYGARHYDAVLGRWHVIDPLNETNYTSGYSYCLNNPLRYIDVMGLDTINVNNLPERNVRFNPEEDVVALNEVVVTGNKPNASFGMNALNFGLNIGGTTASTSAGLRYTERPWGGGYFRTKGGKTYPMSILSKQSNGKYVRGVQGYRNAMNAAKKSTKLLRSIGNYTGIIGIGISTNNFQKDMNTRNFIDLGASLTSLLYWEIGAIYTFGSIYSDFVVMPNILQVQKNIMEEKSPLNGVYNPQTGMYDY